jgi:hypothetical protein
MAFRRIIVIDEWGNVRKEMNILSPNPNQGAEEITQVTISTPDFM